MGEEENFLQMILSLKSFRAHPANVFPLVAVSQLVLRQGRGITKYFTANLQWTRKGKKSFE